MDKPISENSIKIITATSKLETLRETLEKLNHDVRTPITGIIELASLLIEDGKEEVEVRTIDLKMIKESAESIIGIIDGVLAENTDDSNEADKGAPTVLVKALIEKGEAYTEILSS